MSKVAPKSGQTWKNKNTGVLCKYVDLRASWSEDIFVVIDGQDVVYSPQDFLSLYEYVDPTDPVEDDMKIWDSVLSTILSSPTFDGNMENACEKAFSAVKLRRYYKSIFNNQK